jgi:hypothetical protein
VVAADAVERGPLGLDRLAEQIVRGELPMSAEVEMAHVWFATRPSRMANREMVAFHNPSIRLCSTV